MRRLFILLFTFLVSFHTCDINAQTKTTTSSQQKKADKKKAAQKKKAAKSELKAKRHIEKIQTKEVRKRMKKHKKQVTTPYRKPNFFQRLFHKKH